MEIYTDGIGDYTRKETNTKKRNLHALKIELLSKKLKKKNIYKEEVIKILKNSCNELKLINKIKSNSNIEFTLYNNTSIPANLSKDKCINEYNFFVIIIGIIDGVLDNINHNINFELNFVDTRTSNVPTNERLEELYEQMKEFLAYRKLILTNYIEYTENIYPEIVKKSISNYPSHKYFSQCYNDSFNNSYQVEFINAYNIGYKNYNSFDFDTIYEEYLKLYVELKVLKDNLKLNEEWVKRK